MRVTNIRPGPAGIHTKAGIVFLEPGESADLDVDAKELESAKAAGHFEFGGKTKVDEDKA